MSPRYPKSRRTTVEQTVRFYRISLGKNDDGAPGTYDVRHALEQIQSLPCDLNAAVPRYLPDGEGNVLFTHLRNAGHKTEPHREAETDFELWLSNRTNLPQIESGGNISDLLIADSAGLATAIYAVFFPPNIIGTVSDGRDIRIAQLGKYMTAKGLSVGGEPKIQPIIHREVRDRLERLGEVSLFQFAIVPSYVEVVESIDHSLAEAFRSIRSVWEGQERIEVIIRPMRNTKRSARMSLVPTLQELIGRIDFFSNSKKCKVTGKLDGTTRQLLINVLSDKLSVKKQIEKSSSRSSALLDRSAYMAIKEAYTDLYPDIAQASGVELWDGYGNNGKDISSLPKEPRLF